MAFDELFEFIDKIQKHIGTAFEQGWLYILIIVGFFCLIATIIIVLVFSLKGTEPEQTVTIPVEKQEVINNALGFCNERNFNSWEWKNESSFEFICINKVIVNNSFENFYAG